MNKNAIQKYAVWARNELIAQVKQRAYLYGMDEKGKYDANAVAISGRVLSGEEQKQRREFISRIQQNGYQQAVEEVAYTWFNRFVALRYMEVNDFLPTHVRVLSDTNGDFNPEILKDVLHLDLPGLDKMKVSELLNANKTEDLYRYLLLTQCNALNALLPEMFERMGAYTEMLLPGNILKADGVIGRLVSDIIPENTWRDGVQIIGWLYQYYNTEPKQAVFDGLKKNIKITKENIPAATQLFTPDWIVRYMVENSLGRIFIGSRSLKGLGSKGLGSSIPEAERVQKEKEIADEMGWKYYLPEAEQSSKVRAQLPPTPYSLPPIEDLKILDPCMGSGHILVYAFDVLMQIYTSEGYSERDAAKLILEKNLYGLEIDRRAYQLAYFALMMKARQYNRRILTLGVRPQVYEPTGYEDGMEYGSLVRVDELEPMPEPPKEKQMTLFDDSYETKLNTWHFRRLLAQKYDVVVTNPPYMGINGASAKLTELVKDEYPDSKSDLSTAFMEKTLEMCKQSGLMAMINIPVWMFLSSYEKLRGKLLNNRTIVNLLHFGRGIFGADFGTTSFVIKASKIAEYVGTYRKLYTRQGAVDNLEKKIELFYSDFGKYSICEDDFLSVPGMAIAYSASQDLLNAFKNGRRMDTLADPKVGLQTGDNSRFLRYWYEVELFKCGFSLCQDEANKSMYKWFPYNKGGGFQKWYGNNEYMVNWEREGFEIRNFKGSVTRNPQYYFKQCLSWCKVTISGFSMRYIPQGFIFDVAGCSLFTPLDKMNYVLGYANSKVNSLILSIISPTVNYEVGHVASLPILGSPTEQIDGLVASNINLSRFDWDAFETSWDFTRHPFIADERVVAAAFAKWEREAAERFDTLKANEEELNRIFIDIYGLQNELTPEVEDKDVTVRRANLPREIRSLISYAVGCMFGRYSPYKDGLIYAGGEWNIENFKQLLPNPYSPIPNPQSLLPDTDNILPICDDEYFDDDIAGRFVGFVKTVYGTDTLEENLKFIADALGGKGTPREVIRNYFLNDFYKDHLKIYQKRPIYWLFDSGKKNGFKALIYMHRYSRDLLAKLRTDYVHEQQERYRSQLSHIASALNTAIGAERARLLKQQDKLAEQAREIGAYEEKVHHLADMHITIDLDDGVKKNYAIFDDVLAKI